MREKCDNFRQICTIWLNAIKIQKNTCTLGKSVVYYTMSMKKHDKFVSFDTNYHMSLSGAAALFKENSGKTAKLKRRNPQ